MTTNAMVALDRCRRAWERTSPQLVIDGWLDMLDALDEPQGMVECRRPLRFVEPVRPPHSPAGGLNADVAQLEELRASSPVGAGSSPAIRSGAEPCCGTPMGLTASPAAADTATPMSSAPLQYDGPCRISPEEQRGGGQEGV